MVRSNFASVLGPSAVVMERHLIGTGTTIRATSGVPAVPIAAK